MINSAKDTYNTLHHEMDTLGEDHSNSPWHSMAKQHIGNLTGWRILEIGCGRGGFSKYLQGLGADLVAADFSEAAVDSTQRLLQGLPNCKAEVIDIQNIPYREGEFDMVISLETLEHVPDPDKGMSELVRVTKPNGKILITTPNYFGGQGIYRTYRNLTGRPFTEVGQPINQPLKLKDRVRALKKLKCKIDIVDGCGHYIYVPGHIPFRAVWMDNPRFIMKWFAAHSLTLATKL